MNNRRREPLARARSKYTNYKVYKPCELFDFLQEKMPDASRAKIKSFLSKRLVFVNKVIVTQYNYPLEKGMLVQLSRDKRETKEFSSKLVNLIYEDAYLLVVEKKSGVLCAATANKNERSILRELTSYVQRSTSKKQRAFLIHKLERGASGLMIYAKDEKTKSSFQDNWKEVMITHKFVGVVYGEMAKEKGMVTSWLESDGIHCSDDPEVKKVEERAVTKYSKVKSANGYTLVEFEPLIDRNNKIRFHMEYLGHKLLDRKEEENPINRLALHSFLIRFRHPVTREVMKFELPYPAEFRNLLVREEQ